MESRGDLNYPRGLITDSMERCPTGISERCLHVLEHTVPGVGFLEFRRDLERGFEQGQQETGLYCVVHFLLQPRQMMIS